MFVLSGFHDFSPSKRLAHNALNLNRKLLHYQLVKTIHPKGFSQELVIDVQLILMWKIASHKSVDCASSIFSHIRYCSSSIQNIALPYMLIYFLQSLIILTFPLIMRKSIIKAPKSFLAMFLHQLEFSRLMQNMNYIQIFAMLRRKNSKIYGKNCHVLNLKSKITSPILASSLLIQRFVRLKLFS